MHQSAQRLMTEQLAIILISFALNFTKTWVLGCPIAFHADCPFKPLRRTAQRTAKLRVDIAHAPEVAAADSSSSSDSATQGNGRKSVHFKPWRRTNDAFRRGERRVSSRVIKICLLLHGVWHLITFWQRFWGSLMRQQWDCVCVRGWQARLASLEPGQSDGTH